MLISKLFAVVALISALHGSPVSRSYAGNEAPKVFCSSPGPRHYAAPFSKLPRISPVPPSSRRRGRGNLPFGPGTVDMYLDTEGPAIVRPDQFGYAFWDVGFERNPPVESALLGWRVAAQLWSLDSVGEAAKKIDQRRIHIGKISDAYQPSLNLALPHAIGFYRYDIQISGRDGKKPGSYSKYLRVVPEDVKVRLGINRRRFRPGQPIATRPEVLGTNPINYGDSLEVDRMTNGHWHRDLTLGSKFWEFWSATAAVGRAGRCSRFTIPAGTPPGRYQVRKSVGVEVGRTHWLPLTLTARFSVTP